MHADTDELTKTDAVTVRRKAERADYRRATADAILDEALVAHVGIAVDGQPFVIPMAFGRDGDRLVLHGSVASRLLRTLGNGDAGVRDGHAASTRWCSRDPGSTTSMNYRSVVIVGRADRSSATLEDEATRHAVPRRARRARAVAREARAADRRRAPQDHGRRDPDRHRRR